MLLFNHSLCFDIKLYFKYYFMCANIITCTCFLNKKRCDIIIA